jgi:hypothetical protein
MKKNLLVLAAHSALAVSGFSQSSGVPSAGGANAPFKLEITANPDTAHAFRWDFEKAAQTTVRAGSPIVLGIRKTNISDREIDKWSSIGEATEIRDEAGNLIEPRPLDENHPITSGGEGMLRGTKDTVLQPQESKIRSLLLTKGYDLSQAGTYTVQISEHTGNDPASPLVKSNIITITVLPKDEPAPK